MDIRVSGHQVETGSALQAHAEERLTGIVDKYFSRALSSQVTLGKGPHGGFRCDIVTHVTQGLILKGPRRIYDGYLSSVGMLFAQKHGFFRPYHDRVFEMFWTHQLDIDVLDEMKAVIAGLGGSADDYAAYAASAREEHDGMVREAEALGVFGVPSMLIDGELFWGGDRIDMLRQRIEEKQAAGAA